ncbi:MAG: glycosyltransferase, partial [Bacteroidota bacterium]
MPEKKKIILTVTNDLSYDQRMIRICGSLAKAGYEVLLVGRWKPRSIALKKEAFRQKRLWCFFQKGKAFYLEYNLRLFFYLAFAKCHAICAIDLDTILPVLWAGRLRGRELVFDAHEHYTETPEVVDRPTVKAIWNRVANYAVPQFTHCYTVCQSLADIFEELYNNTFTVVRNVPLARPLPVMEDHSDVRILLYQGVLNEGRGLEALIAAMQRVEGAQLWLAGEGDRSFELREQVREQQLEDRVRFLGYLAPVELKKITERAYLGFNLLENRGLSYYYSLANKFFDYVQAQVPALNM